MVHKNVNIELTAKLVRQVATSYLSVVFERPANFTFEAGDWMDIELKDTELKGGKTYSFASSPTEPDLYITFREGISPFKRALALVKPGTKLIITQYGNDYGFRLRDNRSSTLIAGGIGIAPFRSMLKEMADTKANNTVQLIYLNKSEDFVFKDELDMWQGSLLNLSIDYIVTKELSRKKREKVLKDKIGNISQQFYIAGPTSMVEVTKSFLRNLGIEERNIKADSFGGY